MGYIVAVPEVYHSHELPGCVLGYDDAGKNRGNELKQIISMADFDADIRATVETLQKHISCNGKIGAVGICLGGHLAYRAALLPQILATACFYPTDLHSGTLGKGDHADSLARAKDIKGEMLMVFGKQDPHVPLTGRQAIYKALEISGVWFTWHEFNAAHAFMRDEGERYDPTVTKICISLASDLFQRNL
jgi:carboxymethylenebutenolidase